jgi:hypothetical protein
MNPMSAGFQEYPNRDMAAMYVRAYVCRQHICVFVFVEFSVSVVSCYAMFECVF